MYHSNNIGLCGCSVREAFSSSLLVLEKVQKEEGHGLFQFMYVCQIPPRVTQLH